MEYVRSPVSPLLVIFPSDSRDETAQFQLSAICQTSSIIGFQSSLHGTCYILYLHFNVTKFCSDMKEDSGLRLAAVILMHLRSYKLLHISVYVRLSVYLCSVLRTDRDASLGYVTNMGDFFFVVKGPAADATDAPQP